ncbi:MAG: hypothetical protein ACI4PV_08970 [Butyricicoccus sp.]
MSVQVTAVAYFIGFFLLLAGISLWSSKKKAAGSGDEVSEHFLGGKSIPFFVLAMSYCASFASAGSFMGDPAIVSYTGYPYLWFGVFLVPGCVFMSLVLIRKMRLQCEKLGCQTPIEYIAARYDSKFLRVILAIVITGCFTMTTIAQTKAAAVLLEHFTGVDFRIAIIIVAVAIVICTVSGGLRSVAWTDTIQGCMMVALCVVLITTGLVKCGGFNGVDAFLAQYDSKMLQPYETGLWSNYGLLGVLGYGLWSILIQPAQPYLTARYMAMEHIDRKTVGKFCLVALIASLLFCSMPICGLTGRVLFPEAEPDYIVVTLATGVLHPLLSCAIMLGLFSAIISTATSMLLTVGQSVGRDILSTFKKDVSLKTQVNVANVACVIVMLAAVAFNLWKTPEIFQFFNLMGQTGVGAACCMPLYCGVLYSKSTKEAAIISAIVGIGTTILFNNIPNLGFGIAMGAPLVCVVPTFFVVNAIVNKVKGRNARIESLGAVE